MSAPSDRRRCEARRPDLVTLCAPYPKWVAPGARRDDALQPGLGSGLPIPVPRFANPHPVAQHRTGLQPNEARGEPDAVKVAHPVRAGGLGKRTWKPRMSKPSGSYAALLIATGCLRIAEVYQPAEQRDRQAATPVGFASVAVQPVDGGGMDLDEHFVHTGCMVPRGEAGHSRCLPRFGIFTSLFNAPRRCCTSESRCCARIAG